MIFTNCLRSFHAYCWSSMLVSRGGHKGVQSGAPGPAHPVFIPIFLLY